MRRLTLLMLVVMLAALSACTPPTLPATGQANPPPPGPGAPGSANPPQSGPGPAQPGGNGATPSGPRATAPSSASQALAGKQQTHDEPADYEYDPAAVIPIQLDGSRINAQGVGLEVDGSSVTISAAGTYSLSGMLSDGQVRVDTQDDEVVRLIFNGVDITSSNSAPVNILAAEKVVILLAENTQNMLTDGNSYEFDSVADEEPNAALFSKADLTIGGSGALTVRGNFRDGINSKDGLVIASGSVTVSAVDDGLRGKDYLQVLDGQINVTAQGDGLKSDNEEDAGRGYIAIQNGSLQVISGGDAIHAQTDVVISGGTFQIQSGGGSQKLAGDVSTKGIKGLANVTIEGGSFQIDAADDGLHSNGSITINGGTFTIATGDDGMHADASLTINNGAVQVSQSYEGLESAVITLNGGTVDVASSDDGINVAGGADSSGRGGRGGPPGGPGGGGMGPGQDAFASGSQFLYINGGLITVNAQGDGLDVNGAVEMTGGTMIVSGPTQQMNAALDHSGFKISGGLVVAAGSSGMAQTTGQNSSMPGLLIFFTSTQPAGSVTHIQNGQGENVLTFAPAKAYTSLAFSSDRLVEGETYTIFTGGQAAGDSIAGYYPEGGYSGGTKYGDFTVSGMVTTVGTGGRGGRQRP